MTIPIPVLDDRSFEELVAEAKARIPVHTPEWTNLNASDPGVTIVELFAFLTDNLLYRSNRIPEANRLKFLSMLGISLMPPSPGRGLVTISNDAGPLTPLRVDAGAEVRAAQVPFRTQTALAVLPVTAAVYVKRPQPAMDEETAARYRLIYSTFLDLDTDTLTFYQPVALDPPATGRPDPVVDLGDTVNGTIDRSLWIALLAPRNADLEAVRAAVAGQTLTIGVYPATGVAGRVLVPQADGAAPVDPGLVVEVAAPQPDPSGLVGPGFGIGPASYTRLPPSYADPVLTAPGILQVALPEHDRLLVWAHDPQEEGTGDYPPRVDDDQVAARIVTWLRLRFSPSSGVTDPDTAVTGPGAADAGCGCGCGDGSATLATTAALAAAATGRQAVGRITWAGVNAARVLQTVPVRQERLGVGTGTPFQTFTVANTPVVPDATGGGFTLTVQALDGTRSVWHAVDDIYAAAADEPAYLPDWTTGRITTGSGLQGARVPLGATVLASYSFGGGPQGQAAVGDINRSIALPGGYGVTNPVPTWGAGPGESVADGEATITRWLRHRDRLVTADDFRDVARRTPGVDLGRVEVLPMFHPEAPASGRAFPGVVTLLLVPRSDPLHPLAPVPDRQFLDAVCRWLDPRRLVTTELHVRGPEYRPIWVSVGIQVLGGQVPSLVLQAVRDAVQAFLSPLTGGVPTAAPPDGLIGATTAQAGTGWPLDVDVRGRDVEAVATRVLGVRFVTSVRMAARAADGTVVAAVDPIILSGLALPAATVFANVGPPDDPAALIGSSKPTPSTQVAVPLVPPTC